jgi:transposase-like protein
VRIGKMYLIDGTYTKIGGTEAWIWVAIEPVHSSFGKGVYISIH